jgi:hypothetical protein
MNRTSRENDGALHHNLTAMPPRNSPTSTLFPQAARQRVVGQIGSKRILDLGHDCSLKGISRLLAFMR